MATFKNYYSALAIENFAEAEAVKQAYRQLARKYHPDLNAGDINAEEKFKAINEAYEILSNPTKRQAYDDSLKVVASQYPNPHRSEKNNRSESTSKNRGNPKKTTQSQSKKADPSHSGMKDAFEDFLKKKAFVSASQAK